MFTAPPQVENLTEFVKQFITLGLDLKKKDSKFFAEQRLKGASPRLTSLQFNQVLQYIQSGFNYNLLRRKPEPISGESGLASFTKPAPRRRGRPKAAA